MERPRSRSSSAHASPAVCELGVSESSLTYPERPTRSRARPIMLSVEELDKLSRNSLNWEDFFGSSLDLAPSLLNLYDHRIAAGGNNKSSDDDDEDDTLPDASVVTVVTKSQSLPTSSGGVTSTSPRRIGQLPGQKLPSDRPMSMMDNVTSQLKPSSAVADSKKRPLSISSMSSVSSSSLPRLRKKRAGPTPSESSLTSDTTITPRDTTFLVSHSRQSVDSGCVEGTNGDKYFDNMSITSSDTGSFRDEVDSNSMRDYSLMSSSPSDKSQILTSSQSQRSNSGNSPFPSPDSKAREPKNNSITSTSSGSPRPTRTSSLRRPQFPPSDSGLGPNKPYKYHQLSAVHTSSDSRSKDAVSSPDITRRSFQANARQEARKRFFSNYEEHLNQSANVDPDSLEHSSPSQTRSHRSFHGTGQHRTSSPSSPTATAARTSPASSSPSATAANGERRRENSSQISFTSEKATARRAERKSMSGKHDGGPPIAAPTASPASQKYAFSRASKKKDGLGSSDPANKSSPVYVSYVQRVVTEIIESERTYIASLKDIIEGYLEPLAKLLSSPDAKEFVVCLFSNIREIYSFGCAFLEDLEQTGADPVKVAKCFVRHNKGFVIYTDYCTNYPRAVEVLTSFMQHPELSELFRERQMALGHGLPLGAYLLRPVQRILKYHLLLQNIVKHYEKEGGEAEVLKQAFHHMTQMAHHINEMKRKHEHAVRIQEIQSQLEDYVGDDLTRLGELVLESTFRVYGAKASRQVFLFERGLLISKKKEGGMLSFKTLIKCSNLMLVEVIPNEPFSFHVIPFDNPRAQYTLQARNMELKRKWCQEIKRLILESFKGRIPDNVKNLVMQLGREHDDDYVPKEALEATRKNQHTAPEYLEKRRFRRKSGSRMPDFSLLKPQRVRRGGNKKGENKSGDKSPDRGRGGRRAESKSPEAHRRLFSRQNNMAKRRAQSHSTSLPNTPNNDMSYPELFNQSKSDSKKPISQPVTPDPKEIKFDSPSSSTNTTPENSAQITLRRSLIRSLSESDDGGKEPGGMKRPASFLMARARPICSEDLTELVVRCGGSVKMASHAEALEEGEEIQHFSALSDSPSNPSDHSLRRRSAVDDSSEVDDDDDDDDDTVAGDEGPDESVSVSEDMITDYIDGTEESHFKSCDPQPVSSETNTSLQEQMTSERSEDQMKTESRSSSLPILSQTDKDLNEAGGDVENSDMTAATKATSQSSDSVYDKANMPKPRGRLSRRDLQNVAYANGHNVRKKGKTTNRAESPAQESKEGIKVSAFHDTYSKRTAEKAVLRKKGLRLPNTSKHLSVQDSLSSTAHPSGVKAKLTNWNSVDKLTKGSMTDLSHVNEDPWVMNPEVTGSRTSVDEEVADRAWPPSCGSHGHPPAYPRSQSDLTEIAQVSTNKENLDWLVYLNRNYKTSPTHLSSNPPQKLSSPLSSGKDNYNSMKQISSQVPYATPPRSYMTTENMKKLGSSDNSLLTRASFQRPSSRDSTSSSVNAFGSPSMTVTLTKPVSFSAVQLSRSNSSPVTNRHTLVLGGRNRPVSMDMETLTDESNRMVAEMEEYINKTSSPDNIKSPNKFPTSLPTITVEDDSVDCNRLSMVSSISTSSYESQGSSSSDGLVGTLKHKLHSWAQGSRSRNDSEFSQASTLTSDEEDEEETPTHATSGNTFEPPSSTRNLWKEDRDLETVLREHSLGSSKLGSRMAHAYPIQSEIVVSHHSADTPVHEGRPHSTCGLTAVENASQLTEKTCAVKENLPDQARFSLPPTTEATEALMPKALKNCEIQQSDSGFSLQSNDSTLSDQNQVTYKSRSEAVLELSEESSREVTPKVKPKVSKSQPPQVPNADLKRNDSCESIDSTDSFYERKLSLAFDSDIFQEKPATFSITEEHQPQGQVEIPPPRKSIREYVHAFEEKCRSQSPKVFEIKRREPGAMIRQRLETLQESLKYGSRSSSNHSSRPVSEERESLRSRSQPPSQQHSSLNFHPTLNNKMNEDIRVNCLKTSRSRDSLSKSAENLSRSRENLFSRSRENLLSRSRDNVFLSKSKENLYSGGSWSKASSPSFTVNFNRAGHEKDANRFHYIMAERSDNLSNNQFIHRARSNSDQPPQEAERSSTPGAEGETLQSSKSLCHIDQMSSEVDNLVIMKGWVRALIAKFQDS